jgi:cytoskeletal protein RodZ
MGGRIPHKLFGDRVRTSTVLLSLLFVAVFVLYLFVRPTPVDERLNERPAANDVPSTSTTPTPTSTTTTPSSTTPSTSTTPTTPSKTPTTPKTTEERPPPTTTSPKGPAPKEPESGSNGTEP